MPRQYRARAAGGFAWMVAGESGSASGPATAASRRCGPGSGWDSSGGDAAGRPRAGRRRGWPWMSGRRDRDVVAAEQRVRGDRRALRGRATRAADDGGQLGIGIGAQLAVEQVAVDVEAAAGLDPVALGEVRLDQGALGALAE